MNVKDKSSELPYNFKTNFFLSNDELQGLIKIHKTFADQVTPSIATLLKTDVKFSIHKIEQISVFRFSKTLSNQSFYASIKLSPLSKQALFSIDPEISYLIVERLLGGNVAPPSYFQGLNSLEFAILRQFTNQFISVLSNAWMPYLEVKPYIEELGIDQSIKQWLQKPLKCLNIIFKISVDNVLGLISLTLPCESLQPFKSKFVNTEKYLKNPALDAKKIKLDLKALIGSLQLSSKEVSHLKNGDILKLDHSLEQPIKLFVENQFLLSCQPGLIYKNKGIKLT
jgi:flagellar motor switch protein FliM